MEITTFKQRRIQASLAGSIILATTLLGIDFDVNIESLTEQISQIIVALSALATTLLPLFSYFFPKK